MSSRNEDIQVAKKFSDMGIEKLEILYDALSAVPPNKFFLEVGTRMGGSALLMILSPTPCLAAISVDPYGSKPYPDGVMKDLLDFSDEMYRQMMVIVCSEALLHRKTFLQFKVTSEKFIQMQPHIWIDKVEYSLFDKPLFSYVLLDGEHNDAMVESEVHVFKKALVPGGKIIVDNADWIQKLPDFSYPRGDIAIFTKALA